MNTIDMCVHMERKQARLSTLWIFLVVNYIYADIFTNMQPEFLQGLLAGNINGISITQEFLLGASMLMEISMGMIILSRVLRYKANRWANIIAGTLTALVQSLSLFVGGGPSLHYMFFSVIEISCSVCIVWYAWTWNRQAAETMVAEHKSVVLGNPAGDTGSNG